MTIPTPMANSTNTTAMPTNSPTDVPPSLGSDVAAVGEAEVGGIEVGSVGCTGDSVVDSRPLKP